MQPRNAMDRLSAKYSWNVAPFIIALTFTFLAKGLALVPGYAFDDYAGTYADQSLQFYLSQGRYTQALLQWVLTHAKLSTTDIAWVTTSLCLLALAGIANYMVTHVMRKHVPLVYIAAPIGILCAYPYFTEYFTFRQAAYNEAFYLLFTLAHLQAFAKLDIFRTPLSKENRGAFLSSVAWLLLAMGGHQITLGISACIIYAITLTTEEFERANFSARLRILCRALLSPAIALVCYLILYKLLKMAAPQSVDPRGNILALSAIPERLANLWHLSRKIFLQGEPTVSALAKGLLAIGAIIPFAMTLLKSPGRLLFWVIGLVGLIILAILPLAVSGVWWPVPRALSGLGFVFGSMAASLLVIAEARKPVIALPWICASLLLAFNSAAMLQQQQRLNRWDLNRAQLIVHDIQLRYGETPSMTVTFVGASWKYPRALSTTDGDLNASAFLQPWSIGGLLSEASGDRINVEKATEEAQHMCASRPKWPNHEAIFDTAGRIFVCL